MCTQILPLPCGDRDVVSESIQIKQIKENNISNVIPQVRSEVEYTQTLPLHRGGMDTVSESFQIEQIKVFTEKEIQQ